MKRLVLRAHSHPSIFPLLLHLHFSRWQNPNPSTKPNPVAIQYQTENRNLSRDKMKHNEVKVARKKDKKGKSIKTHIPAIHITKVKNRISLPVH